MRRLALSKHVVGFGIWACRCLLSRRQECWTFLSLAPLPCKLTHSEGDCIGINKCRCFSVYLMCVWKLQQSIINKITCCSIWNPNLNAGLRGVGNSFKTGHFFVLQNKRLLNGKLKLHSSYRDEETVNVTMKLHQNTNLAPCSSQVLTGCISSVPHTFTGVKISKYCMLPLLTWCHVAYG